MIRVCNWCYVEFESRPTNVYGLCKKCSAKRYREANKVKLKIIRDSKKEFRNAQSREYYKRNKEIIDEKHKMYRDTHKEESTKYQALYHQEYKQRINKRHCNLYHRNRRDILYRRKELYRLNYKNIKVRRNLWSSNYYFKNKNSELLRLSNNRASRRSREGILLFEDTPILFGSGSNCVYCNKDTTNDLHIDHIVPLSKFGSNWVDNMQLLCSRCNLSKYNKLPWDYEKEIGFARDPEFWINFKLYHTPDCFYYTGEEEIFQFD